MTFLMGMAEGISESLDVGIRENLKNEETRLNAIIDRGVTTNDAEIAEYEKIYQENKKAVDLMKSQLDGNMDQVMYYVSNYGIEEAANLIKKMYDGQIAGGRKATEYISVARAGDQPAPTSDHITRLASYEFAPKSISPTLGAGLAPTMSIFSDEDRGQAFVQQGISGQIRTPRYKTNIDDLPDPAKVLMEFKPYKLGTLADPKEEANRLERIALGRLSAKNATEADIQEAYGIKADATFARAIAQLQDSRKPLTNSEIDRITQGFAVSISQTNGLGGIYDGQGNFIDPSANVELYKSIMGVARLLASDAAQAAMEGMSYADVMFTVETAIANNKPLIYQERNPEDEFSTPKLIVDMQSKTPLFTAPAGVAQGTGKGPELPNPAINNRVDQLVAEHGGNATDSRKQEILTELSILLGGMAEAKRRLGI